jgi:hypothetical protein
MGREASQPASSNNKTLLTSKGGRKLRSFLLLVSARQLITPGKLKIRINGETERRSNVH